VPHLDSGILVLFLIALPAATVNGALGYGFSSLVVPVALVFFSNRILSPALVLVELAVNAWILILNRGSLAAVRWRALPILVGLVPGVLLGSFLLTNVNPGWLKLGTYIALLPLILLQAAGFRRPIDAEHLAGYPLGFGIGTLYATTTISGPPLAMMFNNQGMQKEEFRAALGTVRVAETTFTALVYGFLGLYSTRSLALIAPVAPAVVLGLPLGTLLMKYVPAETFRRICMSFDAWIIGFGLSRTIVELKLLSTASAYTVWGLVIVLDLYLLYQYFVAGRCRVPVRSAHSYLKLDEKKIA
jgi:uncharacterized protein